MEGRTMLALGCAIAGGCWLIGGTTVGLARLRARRSDRSLVPLEPPADPDANGPSENAVRQAALDLPRAGLGLAAVEDGTDARAILLQALRSREPEVRRASVVALGRLGRRHDWAIDGLIEALAERRDARARVAAQLDRLGATGRCASRSATRTSERRGSLLRDTPPCPRERAGPAIRARSRA